MSGEDRVQVDILGLSTGPASGGAYALILKEINGPRRLPIIIGTFEAQAIAIEIENMKPPRPLTHDLMKTLIEELGGELLEVTINDLRDGTFYALLNLDGQEIDSRPSDAIALAVRFGAPIYVAEKVMEEASFIPENEEEIKPPIPPETAKEMKKDEIPLTPSSKLEQLQKSLEDAVAKEDYERAARLRDEIKKIQSQSS